MNSTMTFDVAMVVAVVVVVVVVIVVVAANILDSGHKKTDSISRF
ncbi:hypothetical protein [Vibrio sinensis]|nr:hypothetical protein [Vibrio sinensis]